jgi:hypothetical protein
MAFVDVKDNVKGRGVSGRVAGEGLVVRIIHAERGEKKKGEGERREGIGADESKGKRVMT